MPCRGARGASPQVPPSRSRRSRKRSAAPAPVTTTGTPPASKGPRCCRSRSSWPMIPSGLPVGPPARPQHGHIPGRTLSTCGFASSHVLTSSPLAMIFDTAPSAWIPFTQALGARPGGGANRPPSHLSLCQRRADAPLSPVRLHHRRLIRPPPILDGDDAIPTAILITYLDRSGPQITHPGCIATPTPSRRSWDRPRRKT
jgi:hypothetical protein